MRQRATSVEEVKARLAGLMGRPLTVAVNKGRKKVTRLSGEIVDMFPSVFTFRASGELVSFSYSDIICGEVVLGTHSRS